jgi:hypothetical protein
MSQELDEPLRLLIHDNTSDGCLPQEAAICVFKSQSGGTSLTPHTHVAPICSALASFAVAA